MSAGDQCKCGHPRDGRCHWQLLGTLCPCPGFRAPDERPEFDPPHMWEEGL